MNNTGDILKTLAQRARLRVEAARGRRPLEELQSAVRDLPADKDFPFERALRKPGLSFICEVKRASPSRGVIAREFPYRDIAREYERAGADAVSVLTEPEYFLGSDAYLQEIAGLVRLPVLRKDFTVDPYQIYEARLLGASAVLLICALTDEETLREWIGLCDALGLSALVEAHDARETGMALAAGARIVGVNNRNLRTFDVRMDNCAALRPLVPPQALFVAESGVRTRADVVEAERIGAHAVLVGETMMRSADRQKTLAVLRGEEAAGA